jgi:DNA-directed RNA polymerase specialized sigma24 family protein
MPYAGWSTEEIAAQLGRSPAAVKQLRFRAMKRLRALLTQPELSPEEARDA